MPELLVYPDETRGLPKLGNPMPANRATSPLDERTFCIVVREVDEPMPASAVLSKAKDEMVWRFLNCSAGRWIGRQKEAMLHQ